MDPQISIDTTGINGRRQHPFAKKCHAHKIAVKHDSEHIINPNRSTGNLQNTRSICIRRCHGNGTRCFNALPEINSFNIGIPQISIMISIRRVKVNSEYMQMLNLKIVYWTIALMIWSMILNANT